MLRVRSLFTGVPGSPYYSNLFFAGTLSTDASAAVASVQTFLGKVMVLCANPLQVQIEPFVASIDPATGDVVGGFTTPPNSPIAATGAGSPVPPSSQMLAQLRTGVYVAGREVRGKYNHPFVTEEQNVGSGTPAPGAVSVLLGAFNDMLATGPDLLVWSRKNGAAPAVSAVTVSPKWAVLRSRRD